MGRWAGHLGTHPSGGSHKSWAAVCAHVPLPGDSVLSLEWSEGRSGESCPLASSHWGGCQPAPSCLLNQSPGPQAAALKYVHKPLSGEDWEFFTGSLCAEPWEDTCGRCLVHPVSTASLLTIVLCDLGNTFLLVISARSLRVHPLGDSP